MLNMLSRRKTETKDHVVRFSCECPCGATTQTYAAVKWEHDFLTPNAVVQLIRNGGAVNVSYSLNENETLRCRKCGLELNYGEGIAHVA